MELNFIKFDGKPFEKLMDVVSKGIGVLYRPTAIRKEADAEVYRIEKLQEAEAKGILLKASTELTLIQRTSDRILRQEIQRQINLENIADRTLDHLPDEVSQNSVDEDWRMKFFKLAQDVKNEDLQELWAKVLAEEIAQPGRTSLRSLDILQNLSKKEAEIFKKLGSYALNNGALLYFRGPFDITFLAEEISYDDVMTLIDAGLIRPTAFQSDYYPEDGTDYTELMFGHAKIKMIVDPVKNDKLTFEVYAFNSSGVELMNTLMIEKSPNHIDKIVNMLKYRVASVLVENPVTY